MMIDISYMCRLSSASVLSKEHTQMTPFLLYLDYVVTFKLSYDVL